MFNVMFDVDKPKLLLSPCRLFFCRSLPLLRFILKTMLIRYPNIPLLEEKYVQGEVNV